MKKILSCALAAVTVVLTLLVTSAYAAGEKELPTIIVNDEKWYKDTVSPLIVRDGKNYVPAEVFTMLDYISLTYPSDGNLFLMNTVTRNYISVLFMERAAAVNGEIIENIDVFRDAGVFYLDAEETAQALGISYEYYEKGEGKVGIRFYDENMIFSLTELLRSYTESEQSTTNDSPEQNTADNTATVKKIYLFCSTPDDSDAYFPARGNLDYYGLDYTYFVSEAASDERIIELAADGGYCLALPEFNSEESKTDTADIIAAYLDSLNTRLKKLTGKVTRYTLTTGDDELDAWLLERGYYALKPDYTVNGASYPDGIVEEMRTLLEERDCVTIFLEDCWNSERMAVLLSEMKSGEIKTANIFE